MKFSFIKITTALRAQKNFKSLKKEFPESNELDENAKESINESY